MDIIKLTRQLGAEIQKDERYLAFKKATETNDNDEALQNQIGEFNIAKAELDRALSDNEMAQEEIDKLNNKLGDIYREIMANPLMTEYNNARTQLDALLNEVTSILMLCANGADPETCEPSSCSGNCGSCGGCH